MPCPILLITCPPLVIVFIAVPKIFANFVACVIANPLFAIIAKDVCQKRFLNVSIDGKNSK
jgi:hypothetical protein